MGNNIYILNDAKQYESIAKDELVKEGIRQFSDIENISKLVALDKAGNVLGLVDKNVLLNTKSQWVSASSNVVHRIKMSANHGVTICLYPGLNLTVGPSILYVGPPYTNYSIVAGTTPDSRFKLYTDGAYLYIKVISGISYIINVIAAMSDLIESSTSIDISEFTEITKS